MRKGLHLHWRRSAPETVYVVHTVCPWILLAHSREAREVRAYNEHKFDGFVMAKAGMAINIHWQPVSTLLERIRSVGHISPRR